MANINKTYNWTDDNEGHIGGQSYGEGYCIAWQRGPVVTDNYRNGALLLDVLGACQEQLWYFQNSTLRCVENRVALQHLAEVIKVLEARRDRIATEGTSGTTSV